MKRLALAFQSRREQSQSQSQSQLQPPPPVPDVPKKRTGFFSKRGPSDLNVPSNTYSSSSSDDSVVQTPEPEEEPLAVVPSPGASQRWTSWIRPKPAKLPTPPDPEPNDSDDSDSSDHYDDDDDDDDEEEEEEPPPPPPTPPAAPRTQHTPAVLQPATALRAQMNMRAIALASLLPPPSPPPLLHLPASPLFPRSANPARALTPPQTTRTALHKTRLLRRLDEGPPTRAENESIAPLGQRPKHAVPQARRPRGIDEEAMSDMKRVRLCSRGVRVWLGRPPFEERCVQWVWDGRGGGEVVARGIVGSDRAVASLEFSEGLEALGGYGVDQSGPTPSKNSPRLPPLRISEAHSTGSSTPNPSTGPSTPIGAIPLSATPRKILRFLPDPDPEDEEDNVPLGYRVQSKKEREERQRQVEERAKEEERMKRVYAAEVIAARARREGERSGSMHEVGIEKAKDRRQSYTRPAYDPVSMGPRRMASEPDTRPRPSSLSRPPSGGDTHTPVKSRPSSIRSERPVSASSSPPPLPHKQSVGDIEEAKRRRRQSNLSEGAGSTRSRTPSAPAPSARPSMYARTMPRSYSSGTGMSMMPMPVPPMPVPVMPMYVMPGAPQYFVPMHAQAQMQMQMQMQQHQLVPPVRPGLPVSRSAEGLLPPRLRPPREPSVKPPLMPRSVSNGDDPKRASRMSIQVPPVSYKHSPGGSSPLGHRATPPTR